LIEVHVASVAVITCGDDTYLRFVEVRIR
jgi:hypothetical protein